MSVVLAFLLSAAAAAPDQPALTTRAVAPAPAKPTKEKRICKTDDADPASHMIKRTCKTQSEWDQQGVLGSTRSGFSISGDKIQQGH